MKTADIFSGKKLKTKSIVEQVMEEITELILTNALKVGDKLPPETELAERYGVGRSTIREAIKTFHYLGVLDSIPSKGTYVKDNYNISTEALKWSILLGEKDLSEIMQLRTMIEERCEYELSIRIKNNDSAAMKTIEKINNCVSKMIGAANEASKTEMIKADQLFHHTIIDSSDNNLFLSIYSTLRTFMEDVVYRTYQYNDNFSETINHHTEILNAILSGEYIKIIKANDIHNQSTIKELKEYRENKKNKI